MTLLPLIWFMTPTVFVTYLPRSSSLSNIDAQLSNLNQSYRIRSLSFETSIGLHCCMLPVFVNLRFSFVCTSSVLPPTTFFVETRDTEPTHHSSQIDLISCLILLFLCFQKKLNMSQLSSLLEEQYAATEAFANAQSRLLNAVLDTTTKQPKRAEAVHAASSGHYDKRERLRSVYAKLRNNEEMKVRYKEHIELSQRVIETIAMNPSWDEFDFPSHTRGILETNTVALACLKASIARIKEVLEC